MIFAQTQPFIRWDWIVDHLDEIWERTVEHSVLTGFAVVIGLVVSTALSMIALRFRRTYGPITWTASAPITGPNGTPSNPPGRVVMATATATATVTLSQPVGPPTLYLPMVIQ